MINRLLINNIIKKGKGLLAKNTFKRSLLELKNNLKQSNSFSVVKQSLQNSQPRVTFRSKKVSGSVYKIPSPYKNVDKLFLAAKWIVSNSQKNTGSSMQVKLSKELLDSFTKKGDSLKKKKEIHKQAIVNKVNLKYM